MRAICAGLAFWFAFLVIAPTVDTNAAPPNTVNRSSR